MEMSLFARKVIHHYYAVEGGTVVVDDPDDLGGLTGPGGITETVLIEHKHRWAAHGFTGNIADVPYSLTEEIYYFGFWKKMGLHLIETISEDLCDTMFGWGINSGYSRVVTVVQQFINAMNKAGALYPNMTVDGGYGSTTHKRLEDYLKAFANKRGLYKLIEVVLSCQTAYYLEITVERPEEKNERFIDGWMNRVNDKRQRLATNQDLSYSLG